MENLSPLKNGLRVALNPLIWIIAAGWDGLKLALAWWLGQISLGWIRWDFNISLPIGSAAAPYKLVLPPALPSAEQLGISFGAEPVVDWGWMATAAVPLIVMTVAEPLMRAGYLNLVSGTLHGIRPTPTVWWRGVRRFGPGQLLLTLIWIGLSLVQQPVVQNAPLLARVLLPILVICFFIAQYVIVTDDASPLAAIIGAPALILGHLDALITPVLVSLLTSGLISVLLGTAGWLHPLVLIPLWAVVGTALTGTMMSGMLSDISTRNEPGMPWVCSACTAQNAQAALQCAACGGKRAG